MSKQRKTKIKEVKQPEQIIPPHSEREKLSLQIASLLDRIGGKDVFGSKEEKLEGYTIYRELYIDRYQEFNIKRGEQVEPTKACGLCDTRVINGLKSFIGVPIHVHEKTDVITFADRINTCRSCPFYNNTTRTCGTFLLGGKVKHEGKEVELCGCFIPVKARMKNEHCPAEKW